MPIPEQLLAEVLAAPDELAPRLACAEALQPSDAPRARFIRVQCRLSELSRWHPERPALLAEQAELAEAHAEAWLEDLGCPDLGLTFARGFAERAAGCAADLLAGLPRLLERGPVLEIDLADSEESASADEPLPDPALAELAASPLLSGLAGLLLTDASPHEDDLRRLLSSPRWGGLESLLLGPLACSEESTAQALALATPPATLRRFTAESEMLGLGQAGLLQLVSAPWMARLEEFGFRGQGLGDGALIESAEATRRWRLRRLDLSSVGEDRHQFGAEALLSWIEQPWFEGLTHLALHGCAVAEALPRSFARAPRLSSVVLSGTGLQPDVLDAISASPAWSGLTELHLAGNPLRDEGAELLAACRRLPAVLDLAGCGIGHLGLAALAEAPQVSALDLRGNPLDAADWADALETGHLPRATTLAIDAQGLAPDVLDALRARYARLDAQGAPAE